MAVETVCQTPGVIFHTNITPKKITIELDLPNDLNLSETEAMLLDDNIHNGLELVLAKYFK